MIIIVWLAPFHCIWHFINLIIIIIIIIYLFIYFCIIVYYYYRCYVVINPGCRGVSEISKEI